MSDPQVRTVTVNGERCRIWEKGTGVPFGFLAGLGGLPRWSPFLDELARHRRVIVPSLPGFPGATGHEQLDGLIDWITATLDLLEGAELEGADLMGASIGGTLVLEAAAMNPYLARRLVLAAPFGLFDPAAPVRDPWAVPPGSLEHLSLDAERRAERFAPPRDLDPVEWQVGMARASEAAARVLWPTTDTGLATRLHRVRVPALVLWGAEDALIPPSYAKELAARLAGDAEVRVIPAAGHLVELDAPEACAQAILDFLSGGAGGAG